jgi:hypothetical protein
MQTIKKLQKRRPVFRVFSFFFREVYIVFYEKITSLHKSKLHFKGDFIMFKSKKTIIAIVMAIMTVIGLCGCMIASAAAEPKQELPGIVGVEYLKDVDRLEKLYEEEGREVDYMIQMVHVEDYWVVYMEGEADAYWGQDALGIYDHVPTSEEIDYLWTKRIDYDVLNDLVEEHTTQEES